MKRNYSALWGLSLVLIGTFSIACADAPVVNAPPKSVPGVNTTQTPQVIDHSNNFLTPSIQIPSLNSDLTLDERVAKLERQISTQNRFNSLSQLDQVKQQIQALRGQLQVLSHDLQILQKQQRSMYQNLDQRIKQLGINQLKSEPNQPPSKNSGKPNQTLPGQTNKPLNSHSKAHLPSAAIEASLQSITSTPTTSALSTSASTSQFLKEQAVYEAGYHKIEARHYADAITAMQGYLTQYPKGQYASNAHYWLGELFLLKNNTQQAIVEFTTVIKHYPASEKIPDAMLKLGFIYDDKGKLQEATSLLTQVKTRFPESTAARLASNRLQMIKSQTPPSAIKD